MKTTEQAYLETECKLINLMLRHPDVVEELKSQNIGPDLFSMKHHQLVDAIYSVHIESNGQRSLTDDHFRNILIKQGGKGDITTAMQVYHDCMHGVHHSNSKDDLDLLRSDLVKQFVHREGVRALQDFNDHVKKCGGDYVEATRKYSKDLDSIVAYSTNQSIEWKTAEDYYDPDYYVDWLWRGRLANREINLLAGKAGQGKSLITIDIAARLSKGTALPFSGEKRPPMSTAIFAPEDDVRLMASRLTVAGANRKLVGLFPTGECSVNMIETLVHDHDVKLVIFDPISQFIGKKDDNKETEIREFLMPLKRLAEDKHIAICCVKHLNKEYKNRAMLERILGTVAWGALPRMVSGCKTEDDRHLLVTAKTNLGECVQGMPYEIKKVYHGKGDFGKIEWGQTLVQAEATIDDNGGGGSAREDAKSFLQEVLSDGPIKTSELQTSAQDEGIAWRTIRRAADDLHVAKCKSGESWYWSIPSKNGQECLN